MGAISVSMQSAPCLTKNDSMIFALLDQSWYSQLLLNASVAPVSVPPSMESCTTAAGGVESEITLRSTSGADGARRQHCFDKCEMRRVFDRFDENADGLISGEELRRWWMKCCGKEMSDADADSMISCVDCNNDGAVDFEEFLSLYETQCSLVQEQNHDNQRARENAQAENEEEDLMLEAFRIFDRNHDGFISAEELQAVLISLGMPEGKHLFRCEKMIRSVDRNGDGRCDILEFQEMMSARAC